MAEMSFCIHCQSIAGWLHFVQLSCAQQPATSNQQPATSNQQPATSNQYPAPKLHSPSVAFRRRVPTTSQPPANHQPTTSQPPANHQPTTSQPPANRMQDAGCFATGSRMQDAGCRTPCNGGGATDTSPGARDAQDPKRSACPLLPDSRGQRPESPVLVTIKHNAES